MAVLNCIPAALPESYKVSTPQSTLTEELLTAGLVMEAEMLDTAIAAYKVGRGTKVALDHLTSVMNKAQRSLRQSPAG